MSLGAKAAQRSLYATVPALPSHGGSPGNPALPAVPGESLSTPRLTPASCAAAPKERREKPRSLDLETRCPAPKPPSKLALRAWGDFFHIVKLRSPQMGQIGTSRLSELTASRQAHSTC